MPRVPCLHRLGGGPWGLRRRVPDELRSILGKGEIWRSYKTDDFTKAKRMHPRMMAEIEALFDEARRRLSGATGIGTAQPPGAPTLPAASEDDIRAVVLAWFHGHERRSAAEDRIMLHGGDSSLPQQTRDETLTALVSDAAALGGEPGWRWAEREAGAALSAHGFALPAELALRALATELLQRGALESVWRSMRRLTGSVSEMARDTDFAAVSSSSSAPVPPRPQSLTFGALCDAYLSAPERANHSPKTKLKDAGSLRLTREIVGAERPAVNVTREDCQRVRATLAAMPANAAQRYPGLPIVKIVEAARRDGVPVVQAKTVVHHLNTLAALFNWGVREQHIPVTFGNPARGMKASTSKNITVGRAGDRRRPFTPAELNAIFTQPLFVGCKDDRNGYATPGPARPRRGRFWVPLLALFAGLRLNEACQLRCPDIEDVDGVAIIHLRANAEDQRLKTSAAMRRIPVHPELVGLGFLEYVAAQRNRGEARLFPDLPASHQGIYSDVFSAWFARFLDKAGTTSKGAVFHSFRHAFRDAMREAAIPREIADYLFGHADGGQAATYGAGFSARTLAGHVARIAYPGVILSHLANLSPSKARTA